MVMNQNHRRRLLSLSEEASAHHQSPGQFSSRVQTYVLVAYSASQRSGEPISFWIFHAVRVVTRKYYT